MGNINSVGGGESLGLKQAQLFNNHTHLGFPDKRRAMKGLDVCYVAFLGSNNGMGLRTNAGHQSCPFLWS